MRKKIFECPADAMGVRWQLDSLTDAIKEPVSLKWCRLCVFNKIYKQFEIFSEVLLERNLSKRGKMFAFEEVHIDGYLRLNPVCISTGVRYSVGVGSRRKKTNGGKIVWSPLLITAHALERLQQRGGAQRVTPDTLWNETDTEWINFLCRYVLRYRPRDQSSECWLVPFGKGAFVVKPEKLVKDSDVGAVVKLRPNLRNRDEQIEICHPCSHALTAVTYISNWQMHPKQDEVVKVIREGRYDDAYDLIFA